MDRYHRQSGNDSDPLFRKSIRREMHDFMVVTKMNNAKSFGFEEASKLSKEAFWELSGGNLPSWFGGAVSVSGSRGAGTSWIVRFTANPRQSLPAGMFWEEFNGVRMLWSIDPQTGTKNAVISWRGAEPVVLFEIVVFGDGQYEIKASEDLTKFNDASFEDFRPSP